MVPAIPARAGIFSSIIEFFSGKAEIQEVLASQYQQNPPVFTLLLGDILPPGIGGGGDRGGFEIPLSITQDSALIALQNPAGTLPSANPQGNIVVYTVKKGDTPSEIAERFGISLNTLLWANDIRDSSRIQIGDELIILPISGVQYTVKKGDTISSVAKKFKGDIGEIIAYNGLAVGEALEAGMILIIPDGEIAAPLAPSSGAPAPRFSSLPVYAGYYLRPIAEGRKTQGIHGFNGVDLATSCGDPVFASASGTVIIARSSGWNSGYGQYIAISHANGTQTLYAHLSKIYVAPGHNVSQGAIIGLVGSTGRSTGCHIHFEVRGAQNPF